MGLLKTTFDITALLAGQFLGKVFIGIGIAGLIGGSILVPIVVYNVLSAFEATKDSAGLITGIVSVITFFLSVIFTVSGVLMLIWAKKKTL